MWLPWSRHFAMRQSKQGNIQITDAYSTDPEIAQPGGCLRDGNTSSHLSKGAPLMKEALLKETSRIGAF